MSAFSILLNQREAAERLAGVPRGAKPIKKYRSSTKNNIHHFGAAIKKVLWGAYHSRELTMAELKRAIAALQVATSMDTFVKAFRSKKIARLLERSAEDGLFARLLLDSDIGAVSKTYSFGYLNALFNAFRTGELNKWIDDQPHN